MTALHVLLAVVGIVVFIGFCEALADAFGSGFYQQPTRGYRLFNAVFAVILGSCLVVIVALAWAQWDAK